MPDPVLLYLDEHVAKAVCDGLRLRGLDVLTVGEAGQTGASDADQLAFATLKGRVLVTRDADYLRLHAAGRAHAGIVYYRLPMCIGAAIRGLERVSRSRSADTMLNRIEFLS